MRVSGHFKEKSQWAVSGFWSIQSEDFSAREGVSWRIKGFQMLGKGFHGV